MREDDSDFSDNRRRLYRMFFEEYNHQYINYKKYYKASSHYQKRAKQVRWGTGIISSVTVISVLMAVKGTFPDLFGPAAIVTSLLTGVISLIGAIGDFERKAINYYNVGQEHDNLYSKFERMIKVELPNPDRNDEELKSECIELVDEKDELNNLTPQIEDRWYENLIADKGYDTIYWDIQPLDKMQKAQFTPNSDSE